MIFKFLKDIILVLWTAITGIFNIILDVFFTFIENKIPMSLYGLVKIVTKEEVLLYNDNLFNKIILFLAPLVVTFILTLLLKKIDIRKSKKENMKVILYFIVLYIFSLAFFWIIALVIFIIFIMKFILFLRKNQVKHK